MQGMGPEMGPPQAGGGQGENAVIQAGGAMIEAFMSDPSPANQAALIAIGQAIPKLLEQAGAGGQAGPGPQGPPQAMPQQGMAV